MYIYIVDHRKIKLPSSCAISINCENISSRFSAAVNSFRKGKSPWKDSVSHLCLATTAFGGDPGFCSVASLLMACFFWNGTVYYEKSIQSSG